MGSLSWNNRYSGKTRVRGQRLIVDILHLWWEFWEKVSLPLLVAVVVRGRGGNVSPTKFRWDKKGSRRMFKVDFKGRNLV
jgi:hypothetical protein